METIGTGHLAVSFLHWWTLYLFTSCIVREQYLELFTITDFYVTEQSTETAHKYYGYYKIKIT